MSGQESQRNGVLAQYIAFVKYLGDAKRTLLQQVCGAALVLVPLTLVAAVSAGLFVAVGEVDPVVLRWVILALVAALTCGGGIIVRVAVKRARTTRPNVGAQPGQHSIGDEPGAEGGDTADQDGENKGSGTIGA